ncbi:MAG: hypothetical protein IT450_00020 [Phycisphaerales bacterium]|nr:hypothetical protein [Phycisphaerales bacterium]
MSFDSEQPFDSYPAFQQRTVAAAVSELAEAVEYTKIRCVIEHDIERAGILLQLRRDLEAAAKQYLERLETRDGGPYDDLPLADESL